MYVVCIACIMHKLYLKHVQREMTEYKYIIQLAINFSTELLYSAMLL